MTEPDLDLVADVAARETEPPAFGELVHRARTRVVRRRRIGAASAAVLVLAGIGTALVAGVGTSDTPTQAGKPPDRAAPIIDTGRLDGYAGTADGSVLTLWQACSDTASGAQSSCYAAWLVRGPHGTHDGLVSADQPVVLAGTKSFVIVSTVDEGVGTVVHADGTTAPLQRVGSLAMRAGIVALGGKPGTLFADPEQASTAHVSLPAGASGLASAAVGDDGTVWALTGPRSGGVTIARLHNGRWTQHVLSRGGKAGTMPGYVVAGAHHVAALATFDGATLLPVGTLAASSDDGATWTDLHARDVPFATVGNLAVTADGTLFVSDDEGTGHLYRSTDEAWTHFVRVPVQGELRGGVTAAGDRVLISVDTPSQARLVAVDAAGTLTTVPTR